MEMMKEVAMYVTVAGSMTVFAMWWVAGSFKAAFAEVFDGSAGGYVAEFGEAVD